ncbi:hypothetical protein VNO77_31534 [Canavalia gladiata]|uniref:VQ domain-containing protein n=1 Tax=Canavalia gladiata TaxID=3824 RepID=A0AAN9KSI3_CANGL
MDSGNSGSISSSGDEEYDSRADHTVLHPSPFLNQFGCSISQPLSSSSSHFHQSQHHHHPSLFDLSPSYLHALSQSQPNPNSFLNLDTAPSSQNRRSEPDCTDITAVSSSSTPIATTAAGSNNSMNQCLLGPAPVMDNARVVLSSSQGNNVNVRNSKKRTRASRRAPTTVLTTDTSNFRAMVQEFTGIPAPPFSASSSYSRRLDLLTGSSSLRSTTSHLDTTTITGPFYPLRPSPQKLLHHQNPLLLASSSSSSPSPSTLLHNNMVDAIASTTTTNTNNNNNNSSSNNNNNPINYQQQQQLPPDLGLPYHHSIMLSMQNHPSLAFHPPPPIPSPLHHPFGNNIHTGFGAKLPSIEDLGMGHAQVSNNANFVSHEGVPLRSGVSDDGGGRREVPLRSLDIGGGGGSCKLNFSAASSASASLNHEKGTLENNNNTNTTTRGEGTVDSWICSSD